MVDRVWVWKCDACKVTVRREDYGLPRGWVFVKGAAITHRCEECKAGVDARLVGTPQIVANR